MTTWNTNVGQFTDGVSPVNAATVNPVITTLANRDQYLFEQLNSYSDKSVLLSYNQPMSSSFAVGTPVYFNTVTGSAVLNSALAGFNGSNNPAHLTPQPSAFVFGLIKQVYAGTGLSGLYYGDVYVKGLITDPAINFQALLDTASNENGVLLPGPLYLSSNEAGKLSTLPSGASIFVGYYLGSNTIYLSPNIDSLNQLYFNYHLYLIGSAAGTPTLSGSTWSINYGAATAASVMSTTVGWVNATDATSVLGITPPTGAQFYYNLPSNIAILASGLTGEQQKHAILLKDALPAHPSTYTMLFANGSLLIQYDTDHATGLYTVDENGIWWCQNTSNNLPWSNNQVLQIYITKLNPNYAASVVTSLKSANSSVVVTDINGLPAATGDLELKLNLNLNPISATGIGSTVQGLSFDPTAGVLTVTTAPVINSIAAGPGLNIENTLGQTIISLSNYALSGEVEDIEPEEADLVYKGLNSYLRLKLPAANQMIGFIGKFRLPDVIPTNTSLIIGLIGFADNNTANSNGIGIEFDYTVNSAGNTISSAYTSNTVTIPGSLFQPLTQGIVVADSGGNPFFTIPASNLTAGAYVNFRLARLSAGANSNYIGIIGVLWAMGANGPMSSSISSNSGGSGLWLNSGNTIFPSN